jgi:hypothetical protein
MIAGLEKGLADYLAANVTALQSQGADYIARAATSSEEYQSSEGYVIVRCLGSDFVPGSLDVCTVMLEIMTVTPVGVAAYNEARQEEIERALLEAFQQSEKATLSAAVQPETGFDWTGHYAEGFRPGSEAQYFRPYLPLRASLVRSAEEP